MLNKNIDHIPVLLEETLRILAPQKGEFYLDVTAGYGGHASAVLDKTKAPKKAVLVDRDDDAIAALETRFGSSGARIIHQDYLSASKQLAEAGERFNIILADLGASSLHFDKPERGFAFSQDGPLDMRMDVRQDLSAAQIVNMWDQAELVRILKEYGQEPKARAIASRIVTSRPIDTTKQLATVVAQASGWRSRSRIHPATRTFQAIRIAVNDELNQLEQSLPLWMELLNPGGRLVVLSFHSLEDKIVKDFFKQVARETYDAKMTPLTKKPVQAREDEIVLNPRARSAKLRAAAKIKTNRKDRVILNVN
jgi:16S rRNA (cytosine1402-N4)-methyltransferase